MKFAWCHSVTDVAAWNLSEIEQVDIEEYKDLLVADELGADSEEVIDDYSL